MLSLYLAAPGLRPNFELKHKNKKTIRKLQFQEY